MYENCRDTRSDGTGFIGTHIRELLQITVAGGVDDMITLHLYAQDTFMKQPIKQP